MDNEVLGVVMLVVCKTVVPVAVTLGNTGIDTLALGNTEVTGVDTLALGDTTQK